MSESPTKPRLPPELIDHIIDYLHSYQKALSTCSLVCKSWLPTVRYHRFSRLTLWYRELNQLLLLIQSSPDIAYFVEELSCRNGYGRYNDSDNFIMSMVLQKFPRLDRLYLSHLIAGETEQLGMLSRPTSAGSRAVKQLHLIRCTFTISALSNFLLFFPNLESLLLYDLKISLNAPFLGYRAPTDYPSIATKGPVEVPAWSIDALKSMQVGKLMPEGLTLLCDWITQSKPHFSVHSFHGYVYSDDDALPLCIFLNRFGDRLGELDLYFDSFSSLPDTFRNAELNLSHCQNLERLTLRIHLREMFVSTNLSIPFINTLLTQLTFPHLAYLELEIFHDAMQDVFYGFSECADRELRPVTFGDLDILDWRTLEGHCVDGILVELREVVVKGTGETKAIEELMREKYPRLASVLRWEEVPEEG
ncbi:hypothetical protein K474DRAFT_1661825 [Panus rudis PR-1116 ss-1]|nr:hypothetical protein K474DRAFT_1661825 [Panus rudis PR-1116 ss-1]